jgi:signal transduction histidine kinase
MEPPMELAKFTHSIAFRFTAVLFVFAAIVTMLAAIAEITIERKKGIELIENRFELIRTSYLKSLSQALWNLDEDQINAQMRGIEDLPDIAYVEIKAPQETRTVGTLPKRRNTLSRTFKIVHEDPLTKQSSTLGDLRIVASLDKLHQQLADRIGINLMAQSAAIFSLAGFVWLAFRAMITRHLQRMARYTRQLNLDRLDTPLILSRSKFVESPDDELSQVTNALNDMRLTLHGELEERKIHERQIQELNETLEAKVEKRTLQLAESNKEISNALDKLKHTQKQLVESEKMAALGGLVAGVAHEINTPVGNGVTATSHLQESINAMQKQFSSNTMKKSDLEKFIELSSEASKIIMNNLSRASELIRSFKQVAADQTSDNKRVFNIKNYIEEVLLSLKPQLKKTKHTVTVDCPANISIYNEPGAFSHILTNLITNSLMHAYDENDTGHIHIEVKMLDAHQLQITYQDDGKGISPENIKNIFNPFFTTRRGSGGTGLGLHILYNKIAALGGTVACHSEVGKGTSFVLTVPILLPEEVPKSAT